MYSVLCVHCCKLFKVQRTVMPKETTIKFKNVKNQLEFPVKIVANFASILDPIRQSLSNPKKKMRTTAINEHKPCGYAYKVISNSLPHLTKPTKVERHEDCVDAFISNI